MEAKVAVTEQYRVWSKRYRFPGSADRAIKRTHQLPHIPPPVPRKRSRIATRVDHDGQQAPASAGLSESPRPGSVPRDCGTTQLACKQRGISQRPDRLHFPSPAQAEAAISHGVQPMAVCAESRRLPANRLRASLNSFSLQRFSRIILVSDDVPASAGQKDENRCSEKVSVELGGRAR